MPRAPRCLSLSLPPWGLPLLVLALCLGGGCQVVRSDSKSDTGPADLPSLRRASVALQDRIRRERAHVDEYNRQLAALAVEEQRVFASVTEGEIRYDQLLRDEEGVYSDLDLIEAEMAEARAARAQQKGELERLTRELAGAEQELAAVRAAGDRASAELAAEQARLLSLQADLAGPREALALRPEKLVQVGAELSRTVRQAGLWCAGPLAWALTMERALRPFASSPPPR